MPALQAVRQAASPWRSSGRDHLPCMPSSFFHKFEFGSPNDQGRKPTLRSYRVSSILRLPWPLIVQTPSRARHDRLRVSEQCRYMAGMQTHAQTVAA